MDYALKFQKLFHVEAMKLVLVMGIITFILAIQSSLTRPYGNILSSLYTSGNVLTPGMTSLSVEDVSCRSDLVGIYPSGNNFVLPDSSVVPESVTNTDASTVEKEITDGDEELKNVLSNGKGGDQDHGFDFDAERDPDRRFSPSPLPSPSPSEGIELDENSTSETNKEQIESGELSKKDNDYHFKEVLSEDTGPVIPPVILPPELSRTIIGPQILGSDLGTSVLSPVGIHATEPSSKDEESEFSLQDGPTTRINNVTMDKNTGTRTKSKIISASSVTSIYEMNNLLVQSHSASRSMKPRGSSPRDREILSARSQIENAPFIKSDRELHAPLFRNISRFKRSYELMERMLKVYVYKEGAKPIFHTPPLKGIYASEGWFMKQLERNKRFVVKDPRKAHLFYLPFSTRALQQTMYVPNSHSHKNLIEYLKNYLDTIVARHPFWNRTGGADHFLAACHDWAPAETNDYMSTCIRALCNADVSVGFKIGKDASLPETYVHSASNPLRYLGGEPPSKRKILAFFAGGMHGYLRPILLKHWENKDPDMQIYGPMGGGKKKKMNYIQSMKSSKYCICARGYEVNSPRVVESIFFECVPVIISDNFVPPFFEVLNWEAFAVFVPETEIPNLKNILLSIPEERYLAMQMNVKKVQQQFLWHTSPLKYDVFHMILHSIWYNRVFQITDRSK
ncbi:hypothetical protein MKX01_032948 [Papaver californicum]|nr:hypothetical protein MKX01_032948 [Papaver californicum]